MWTSDNMHDGWVGVWRESRGVLLFRCGKGFEPGYLAHSLSHLVSLIGGHLVLNHFIINIPRRAMSHHAKFVIFPNISTGDFVLDNCLDKHKARERNWKEELERMKVEGNAVGFRVLPAV
ncbi:hypothetical protein CBL_09087 [Carabus blaptoides fortunei]